MSLCLSTKAIESSKMLNSFKFKYIKIQKLLIALSVNCLQYRILFLKVIITDKSYYCKTMRVISITLKWLLGPKLGKAKRVTVHGK